MQVEKVACYLQLLEGFLTWVHIFIQARESRVEGSNGWFISAATSPASCYPTGNNTNHYHRLITGITANIEIMCVTPFLMAYTHIHTQILSFRLLYLFIFTLSPFQVLSSFYLFFLFLLLHIFSIFLYKNNIFNRKLHANVIW